MEADARSASPERKLSDMLKHPLRKKGHSDSSNVSIISNDADSEKGGFMRASMDKLRTSRRNSVDTERRASFDPGRRLSKLVPGRSKRKKSRQVEDDNADDELGAYGGRIGSGDLDNISRNGDGLGISADGGELDSVDSAAASVDSSLLTDDEDSEPLSRPTFDTRPSHAGYLTLSSPLIAAETVEASEATAESSLPGNPDTSLASSTPDATSQEQPSTHFIPRIPPPLPNRSSAPTDTTIRRRPLQSISPIIPNRLATPSTVVTPPTPDLAQAPAVPLTPPRRVGSRLGSESQSVPSSPQDTAPARRLRSTTGSGRILNPLTPAIEEANTPGGSLIQPPGSGSFFTSFFSATQNAVNQINSTFSNSTGTKGRRLSGLGESERSGPTGDEEVIDPNGEQSSAEGPHTEKPEPAIATLGLGNLSLSHLGISEAQGDISPMHSSHDGGDQFARRPSIVQNGHQLHDKGDEASAAEAVSAAYSEKWEKAESLNKATTLNSDSAAAARPRSIASAIGSIHGDTTPPASIRNDIEEGTTKRSNSVRSRLSERRRRHRNSSVATGSTVAAALGASHAAIANPAGKNRPTGFAVASSKRNKDFHQLFKSVPEDDYLVEDYSAALQRDILLQGRLYVSERHICFSSNILGWVTNLVISFDEVIAMEKKVTALVFPNAIMIQTLQAKNTFASLINRESTYDLLLGIWRIIHPNVKATELGHTIDNNSAEDKREDHDSTDGSEEDSDEYYDEDAEENSGAGSFVDANPSEVGSDIVDTAKSGGAKQTPMHAGALTNGHPTKGADSLEVGTGGVATGGDFPGPTTHGPTECSDQDTHYDKHLIDATIPATLGKVYSMMFGPQSGVVMRIFLLDDQKSGDLQMEDDKKGLGEDQKSSSYSFIKPLYASIGPKQTKCIVNQSLDAFDLDKAVSVTCSTATPDVPSGNAFLTKTRYCLMWGPGNSTRLIMSCTIEWSSKSWLKGPIEKGANEGQEKYAKDILAFFKAHVATKSPGKSSSKGVKVKGRRKRSMGEGGAATTSASEKGTGGAGDTSKPGDWGLFEPLHAILGAVGDIVGPMISPTLVLGFLLLIVTMLWLRSAYWGESSSSAVRGSSFGGGPLTPQRLAAYEEMWKREESDLWGWLEDRIHLDGLSTPMAPKGGSGGQQRHALSDAGGAGGGGFDAKLDDERMSQRQLDEAIRVTEEKLEALKRVIENKRGVAGRH